MGCGASTPVATPVAPAPAAPAWYANRDKYETIEQVQQAMRQAGLESSSLVLGIDCTASNAWTGSKSFHGQNLHQLNASVPVYNPYQQCIHVIGRTLSAFDDDHLIPMFGFGDARTTDKGVFQFGEGPAHGFEDALFRYASIMPTVDLSGPTSFAPIIRKTMEVVRSDWRYTILLIIADGQVSDPSATEAAIRDASAYPISIVVLGVGDGPFDAMEAYDDHPIPGRKWDNFQFVNTTRVQSMDVRYKEAFFALSAMQEIPDQYKMIGKLGLLRAPPSAAGGRAI